MSQITQMMNVKFIPMIMLSLALVSVSALTNEACESEFHGIKVLPGAKYCRVYDAKNPTAFIYFIPESMQHAVDFYQQNYRLDAQSDSLYSQALIATDNSFRVIMNQDKNGTQVSILHKGN